MIELEELKASWYIRPIFRDIIHQVFIAVAKILSIPTLIEEVKWFLMFLMLEMVFDYVSVLLMIAYKRFLFDAQCDDRGLVIA